MDNFRTSQNTGQPPHEQPRAHHPTVHPFAKTLRRLRTERQLSQQDLASMAGVSTQTIARAEQLEVAEDVAIRRSTHQAILTALATLEPQMSEADYREFFRSAKITPMTEIVAVAERIARDAETASRARDPMTESAYRVLQSMITTRGAEKVLEALEAMCAAWSIDPPPRVPMPLPVDPPPSTKLPVLPNATKVVHPTGAVEYVPVTSNTKPKSNTKQGRA